MSTRPQRALITGITGQDGSYLAELLLEKGYEVHGIVRRVAIEDPDHRSRCIRHLLPTVTLHSAIARRAIRACSGAGQRAAEASATIWRRRASSAHSFEQTNSRRSTPDINGPHYMLASVKEARLPRASVLPGLLLGDVRPVQEPQIENTPFYPRSPYAIAKLYALDDGELPRELTACTPPPGYCSITKSPLRGIEFVTRKITDGVARIKLGLQKSWPRQPRRPARLGPRARLRPGDVAHAAAGHAR